MANNITSNALDVLPISAPSGSQDFNKPLGTQVEFNSHPLSGVNGETLKTPQGNVMDIVETTVTPPFNPILNPGLESQRGLGDGLESVAYDKCPI